MWLWSVMILDVGDSVQLPVLITMFRALEPDSETGPKAWNNLPQSVRSADSLDSLKRKLKFYLFNYVYSRNALSAWFFAVDRALNFYFMIMIMKSVVIIYILLHTQQPKLNYEIHTDRNIWYDCKLKMLDFESVYWFYFIEVSLWTIILEMLFCALLPDVL